MVLITREITCPLDTYRDSYGTRLSAIFVASMAHNRVRFRLCAIARRMLAYCQLENNGDFYESAVIAHGGYRLCSNIKRYVRLEMRKNVTRNVDRNILLITYGKSFLWRIRCIIKRMDDYGPDSLARLLPRDHVSI